MTLIISSPNEKCGIREHSEMLEEATTRAGAFDVYVSANPTVFSSTYYHHYHVVHIDHHAALHAAWTPEVIGQLRTQGTKVIVTQHDTYETTRIMCERGLHNFQPHVDALIVHEPVKDLTDQGHDNVYYWRQPVPELPLDTGDWPAPVGGAPPGNDPPVVGTVGFDFPWKGFELLKQCAEEAGWKTRVFGGTENWLSRGELLKELRQCDATAFLYSTGNSGTSAAIRMGIAARRPVIGLSGCRQFRDLMYAPGILWATDAQHVTSWLTNLRACAHLGGASKLSTSSTKKIEELADRDSWSNAGRRYAALYRRLQG